MNSYEDAVKAVRQRYKNGADAIKITATGGVLSLAKDGQGPQFNMEELRGIVETAADYGYLTAAHAHGAEGMKRAVLAGIHTIEHGTFMTEEIMDGRMFPLTLEGIDMEHVVEGERTKLASWQEQATVLREKRQLLGCS